jgi:hypothetical protein
MVHIHKLILSFLLIIIVACSHHKDEVICTVERADEIKEDKHPIDVYMDSCLQNPENYTTHGMNQCSLVAFEKWERQLDSVVNELRQVLPMHILNEFDRSQQKWEAYYEAQVDFSDELFSQSNGTMYSTIRIHNHLELIRERVLLLESFLKEAKMVIDVDWR